MTVEWGNYPIGRRHYFATACGHRHRTAQTAANCRNRGHDLTNGGPAPVIEVLIRPGRITRTREIAGEAQR